MRGLSRRFDLVPSFSATLDRASLTGSGDNKFTCSGVAKNANFNCPGLMAKAK
jgi:hypothetical protein